MEGALKSKCDLITREREQTRENSEKAISTKEERKESHNKGILFSEQEESCTPGLPRSVKNMWKICPLVRPLLATG